MRASALVFFAAFTAFGASPFDGTWMQDLSSMPPGAKAPSNPPTFTYKTTSSGMSFTTSYGVSYDAKFDGKDYPLKGDKNVDTVSLKRIDANTIDQVDKKDGKVVHTSRMTISPDGRKMSLEIDDKLQGKTFKGAAIKQ